ncbi:hypothetical protein BRADI_3g34485v3 [Brachypodium distachyon]|uniref:Uncharacterized protein n=1 Tax=Brachypodium distachyon TaxID=15368 RepID=A0A2K2D120_BRADI|nr:hypothetical protein BRADI_3g34485v3 [Brachypodium distachyon]
MNVADIFPAPSDPSDGAASSPQRRSCHRQEQRERHQRGRRKDIASVRSRSHPHPATVSLELIKSCCFRGEPGD